MNRSVRYLLRVILSGILISGANALADQTAVRIEAPGTARVGSHITVTVHVAHEGNSYFHFTDWVWLKAGDQEIGRWEFKADRRPEEETFTRQVVYRITGPVLFTAQGNCNIHGSAGSASAKITVGDDVTPAGEGKTEATVLPSAGQATIGWLVSALGLINLALCGFQVATGRRWIKVRIAVHRRTGQALLFLAVVHGGLALLINW